MTQSRQSRKDPSLPKQSNQTFFSPKSNTRIGCWNVRTLGNPSKQNSKLRDVLWTVEEKKIELLALSEVRWPEHGTGQISERMILYSAASAQQKGSHRRGVAVVLSEKAVMACKVAGAEFDPITERLLRIRLKMHSGHVSMIAVYTPTNEEGKEEKTEKFYAELQKVLCDVFKWDMVLIMGDFNVRVGCDDVAWKGTIGKHGPDEQYRNGEYLLDFCALNNLVIANTLFKHKPVINTHSSILQRMRTRAGLRAGQPQIQIQHFGHQSH